MANDSLKRMSSKPAPESELRLQPRRELPTRLKLAFPELREWDAAMVSADRANAEQIRKAMASVDQVGDDYVAIFEEALR